LPDGLDPDQVVLRNPDEWKEIIANAKPIVTHVMQSLAVGRDLNDAKVKTDIASQVLPLIADLPNAIERETFRQELARMLKVDERALIGGKAQGKRVGRRQSNSHQINAQKATSQVQNAGVAALNPSKKIEEYCLGILIPQPDLLYRLDRALQEFSLHALGDEDFGYTENQVLFQVVRDSLEQDELDAHEYISQNLPESLEDLAEKLRKETIDLSSVEERLLEEALRGVIKLRRTVLSDSLNQLQYFQKEAQEKGESNNSYQESVMKHMRMLRTLDEAQRLMRLRRVQ